MRAAQAVDGFAGANCGWPALSWRRWRDTAGTGAASHAWRWPALLAHAGMGLAVRLLRFAQAFTTVWRGLAVAAVVAIAIAIAVVAIDLNAQPFFQPALKTRQRLGRAPLQVGLRNEVSVSGGHGLGLQQVRLVACEGSSAVLRAAQSQWQAMPGEAPVTVANGFWVWDMRTSEKKSNKKRGRALARSTRWWRGLVLPLYALPAKTGAACLVGPTTGQLGPAPQQGVEQHTMDC